MSLSSTAEQRVDRFEQQIAHIENMVERMLKKIEETNAKLDGILCEQPQATQSHKTQSQIKNPSPPPCNNIQTTPSAAKQQEKRKKKTQPIFRSLSHTETHPPKPTKPKHTKQHHKPNHSRRSVHPNRRSRHHRSQQRRRSSTTPAAVGRNPLHRHLSRVAVAINLRRCSPRRLKNATPRPSRAVPPPCSSHAPRIAGPQTSKPLKITFVSGAKEVKKGAFVWLRRRKKKKKKGKSTKKRRSRLLSVTNLHMRLLRARLFQEPEIFRTLRTRFISREKECYENRILCKQILILEYIKIYNMVEYFP
jgi:hypothetical protein